MKWSLILWKYYFGINLDGLYAGGLNANSEFQKSRFPIGKHYFLQSGKRVQQTLCFHAFGGGQNCISTEFHFIFI